VVQQVLGEVILILVTMEALHHLDEADRAITIMQGVLRHLEEVGVITIMQGVLQHLELVGLAGK
jgi:hypothetical protein